MNRIWYYTPDDRTDYPDINLLTPGMGVLTVLCVCLIFASAHLPQLPNPFHILFGYIRLHHARRPQPALARPLLLPSASAALAHVRLRRRWSHRV